MMRSDTSAGWLSANGQLRTANSQSGFALPAAIFLLVVLGGLAGWMMRLTTATLAQEVLELEGTRALQAARAGLEAGIYAARVNGACASQNVTFGGTLSRFTASVACATSYADEGGSTVTLYRITSIACNQPTGGACPNAAPTLPEYAERHMAATVEQ
ncbi:MAG: agglutinin biogenesis protein MshP [Pseudomonadota bacterium]|nr:agglutinin biogenesis protein MshP [Pseudomonadota bacterium]